MINTTKAYENFSQLLNHIENSENINLDDKICLCDAMIEDLEDYKSTLNNCMNEY